MALATRALGAEERGAGAVPGMRDDAPGAPDRAVLKMAERVIREGAAREGKVAADIGPDDARAPARGLARRDRPRACAAAS